MHPPPPEGHVGYNRSPTPTRHGHPESRTGISVTPGAVPSTALDEHTHHCSITESLPCLSNPLCSTSSSSPELCQPLSAHYLRGSAVSRRPWGWNCTTRSLSPWASSTLPFSPVDLFLISPVSRLQMRTPRHRKLRRPVQCRTDGKWQSSDSSPGPSGPGDAPGSRAHCGHPGTNHAPPQTRSGGQTEGRPPAIRGGRESGPSSHLGPEARSPVPGHWAGGQRQQAQASLHSPWPQSPTP